MAGLQRNSRAKGEQRGRLTQHGCHQGGHRKPQVPSQPGCLLAHVAGRGGEEWDSQLFLHLKPVLTPCHLSVRATRKAILGSFIRVNGVNPRLVSTDCGARWTDTPVLVLPVSPARCLSLGTLLHLPLSLSFLVCEMERH